MSTVALKRGMKGGIKKFDPANHQKNDDRAKKVLIAYLNEKSVGKPWTTIENSCIYGIDVLTINSQNEIIAAYDVEVREKNWTEKSRIRFPTINCIERKDYLWRGDAKLSSVESRFTISPSCEFFYVQFNAHCDRFYAIKGSTVLQYPLVRWPNRLEGDVEEYVRQVPQEKAYYVVIGKK